MPLVNGVAIVSVVIISESSSRILEGKESHLSFPKFILENFEIFSNVFSPEIV